MPQNEKSLANLKNGGGSATQAERARKMHETIGAEREVANEIIEYAKSGHLLDAEREVFGKLLAVANQLLNKQLHGRGEPKKVLVDVARELRQTAGELRELIAAQSHTADAESWFADMDAHLQAAAAGLADGARPYEPDGASGAARPGAVLDSVGNV